MLHSIVGYNINNLFVMFNDTLITGIKAIENDS